MAQSKSFFDDVKKEIECKVCQEQFSEIKEPKTLNCFHTFCKPCLENWLRQHGGGSFSCPICRKITECPDNDVEKLQSNLFYKQMAEIVEAYSGQGQEDSPHCRNCDERKPLKFYCSDCNCFLCEECAGLHKKWKDFKGHRVKEIRNFESSDAQEYARRAANVCSQHNDELRFYCEQCNVCLCRDCAFLEHRGVDHNIISIEQGVEKKESEIEAKIREVQANGARLREHKESVQNRRLKVNNSIDEATNEVQRVTEQCILLIRQHQESVTERLRKEKTTIQEAFSNQLSGLDGKLAEIDSSVTFSKDVLDRKNLPEILNVKAMIEQRLQELSTSFQFMPVLDFSEVKYIPNDVSVLKDAPGKLVTTKTQPWLSSAEGKGLTEGWQGEDCNFTVVTKDSEGQTTYSEIDKVDVKINSVLQESIYIKPLIMNSKDGRYTISYRPTAAGEFTVSIKVSGYLILGSPSKLTVKTRSKSNKKSRQSWTGGLKYSPDSGATKGSAFGYTKKSTSALGYSVDDMQRSLGLFTFEAAGTKKEKDPCPICLDTLTNPRSLRCKHVFCDQCIKKAFAVNYKCPVCYEPQGVVQGNQPHGEMTIEFDRFQGVPGFEDYGTIIIGYIFPPGYQGQDHPNPGARYQGTRHTAYLPDTQEGREVLQLLKRAFDARLVFTVGNSNQITWNGIHHKTCKKGSTAGFGSPDPDYLRRVKEQLLAKGIR